LIGIYVKPSWHLAKIILDEENIQVFPGFRGVSTNCGVNTSSCPCRSAGSNLRNPRELLCNEQSTRNRWLFLLIDYNIAYSGGYPTVPASNAFTFRLFDPTGSTEIADALPYVFTTATTGFTGTNGFGEGVVAYYFNSASAPTWDLNYIIKVSGNPAEFSSPLEYDFQLPSAAYQSSSDNATGLANELRTIATQLSIQWGIPLLSDASATSVFTADGKDISGMLFRACKAWRRTFLRISREQSPDTTSASYDTNLSNTYQHRFDNSWVHTSLAAGADLFHLPLPAFCRYFCSGRLYLDDKEVQWPLPISGFWIFWFNNRDNGLLAALFGAHVARAGTLCGWVPGFQCSFLP